MTDYRQTIGKRNRDLKTGIVGTLEDGYDDVTDAGGDIVDGATSTGEDVYDSASGTADDAISTGQDGVDSVQDIGSDAVDGVTDTVDDTLDTDIATDVSDTASDTLDSATDIGSDTLDGATDSLSDVGDSITDTATDTLGSTTDALEGASDATDSFTDTIGDTAGGAFDSISDTADGAIDSVTDAPGDALDATSDALGGVTDGTGDLLDSAEGIGEDVHGATEDLIDDGLSLGDGAVSGLSDLTGSAASTASNIGGDLGVAIGGVMTGMEGGDAEQEHLGEEGGVQWSDPEEYAETDLCEILIQEGEDEDGVSQERYITTTVTEDKVPIAVDVDGDGIELDGIESLDELPTHDTPEQAEEACDAVHGTQDQEDGPSFQEREDDEDTDRQWSDPEEVTETDVCSIWIQVADDDAERFFSIAQDEDGELLAIGRDESAVHIDDFGTMDEIPFYPSQSDAEAACPGNDDEPEEGGEGGGDDFDSDGNSPDVDDDGIVDELLSNPLYIAGGVAGFGALTFALTRGGGQDTEQLATAIGAAAEDD